MNLIEKAQKQSQAIYLACECNIADDISSTITKLLSALEIANEALKFYSLKHSYSLLDEGRNYNVDYVLYETNEDTYADEEIGTKAKLAQEKIKLLIEGAGE